MFSFTDNIVHASDIIFAEPISTKGPETYKFPYLEYPNIYIPNRTLAWTLAGLPEDSAEKQELRRQVADYNHYLHSLEEIDGFTEYFKKKRCCATRSEIATEFSDKVADIAFSLPKCMFKSNIVIMQDYLVDTSVAVSYRANISEENLVLPIGREADAYLSNIDGKKAIWNWVDNGHDFCYYLWDILGGRFNRDKDDTETVPNYWGFDAYDQTRHDSPEPQLVKIFSKLESLEYIKTYTIKPSDISPRWSYYAKADGSIDLALVDTSFLKNKLIMEQIELLLWSSEQDIQEKQYFLTDSENKQFLSSIPGNIGGHNKLRIYGRWDCPSAARHIANGKYVQHRVFFADETAATSAGYRPCAVCMPEEYKQWKTKKKI
jgi:hypothetical protein